MKKKLLLLIFSYYCTTAQVGKNKFIYYSGELNIGNFIGIDLNLNYIFREKYSLKVGYSGNIKKPSTQPDDYQSGTFDLYTLGLSGPYDQMNNYQFAFGKVYKMNDRGTIRANVSIGLGYTIITEPSKWTRKEIYFFGENYGYECVTHNTVSLIINPKIEFPISRVFGLTVSPMAQFNKDKCYIGIGIGNIAGILKPKY
jgi:hypothetical protein